MLNYKKYLKHEKKLNKKRTDNNIYTFDIETTSYFVINNQVHTQDDYLMYDEKLRLNSQRATMYIWQFGINDTVYYGRTWEDFKIFLKKLDSNIPEKKIIFVHNLSFEFQFLKSVFSIKEVIARKSHKPMKVILNDYNIEFHCTYFMSNVALEKLSEIYDLNQKKLSGDLDYSLIRHSKSKLSKKELSYCENDCLVLYEYILRELETYKDLDNLPMTNTGKVRRELKHIVLNDVLYVRDLRSQISDSPKVYDLLIKSFAGGYTHANYIYTSNIIKNVDSYDFASSYPYCMVAFPYPMTEFKKCNLSDYSKRKKNLAYLMRVKLTNIKSKFYNNIISYSKCFNVKKVKLDNGRIISAESLEIVLNDVDLDLYLYAYNIDKIEILDCYYAQYKYLPKHIINFILDKYVDKTKLKGIEEEHLRYMIIKGMFNSIYGMSVTCTIRDDVLYDDNLGWVEKKLDNKTIQKKLSEEKKKGFLNFAWGCYVTSYARNNILRCILRLDSKVIYADTDSIKLAPGYDKKIIDFYNFQVKKRLEKVSKDLNIPFSKFEPVDKKGIKHMIGLFESETENGEHTYTEFITQGAKKYAYKSLDYDKKTGELKENIHITVAGVPKKNGAKCLKSLEDFNDGLLFDYKTCKKHSIFYVDNQEKRKLVDYNGVEYEVSDISGASILPCEYTLSKSEEYADLLNDNSSTRARYNFNESE